MQIEFFKYQGTGNDFILIDNRQSVFPKNDTKMVARMCDRKFGIGADGLILLEGHDSLDFTMVYYNSDGNLSSMCGNGGRCLVRFAHYLGIIKKSAHFEAVDGIHEAHIDRAVVRLGMNDVNGIAINSDFAFLDTGSPHHVTLVDGIETYDVVGEGRKIRYDLYGKEGSNVNFVMPLEPNSFQVRTYERGVEDETLSCGTGVTAVAIAMYSLGKATSNKVRLETPGGTLWVSFTQQDTGYTNVILSGPATQVFKGYWPCD